MIGAQRGMICQMSAIFNGWLRRRVPFEDCPDLSCFTEIDGGRESVEDALTAVVADHLIGLKVLAPLLPARALEAARQRIPKSQRERSADLGEILASCWIDEYTDFHLPVRRLRYKADAEFSMQGDDLIAVSAEDPPRLLKGEAKSRATLRADAVTEADRALNARNGRPKPETLGFLSMRLRETEQDLWAERIEAFLDRCDDKRLEHLLFTLSGNDPRSLLKARAESERRPVRRHVVGLNIEDHQTFIRTVFERVAKRLEKRDG
jgi:hypothetical protein